MGTLTRPMYIKVLSRQVIDDDSLDPSLSAAGWRLAEYPTTGQRVFVRATDRTKYLVGWQTMVATVEVHRVENGYVKIPGGYHSITAAIGEKRENGRARVDRLEV